MFDGEMGGAGGGKEVREPMSNKLGMVLPFVTSFTILHSQPSHSFAPINRENFLIGIFFTFYMI